MRLIIEARMIGEGATSAVETVTLAEIERDEHDLTEFGLSLTEGRALLAAAQSALVKHQAFSWLQAATSCPRCHAPLRHKDSGCIVMRTAFGKVSVGSPRLWACTCDGEPVHSVSPLSRALPRRVTPELEYLQVKWAAHLSFAAAQGNPAAAAWHLHRRHDEPRPGCRQGARRPSRGRERRQRRAVEGRERGQAGGVDPGDRLPPPPESSIHIVVAEPAIA